MPRLLAALLLLAALPLAMRGPAAADPVLRPDGPAVVVFSHARDACDALDIPDAPARAIRAADGSVQIYATHFRNRRLVGPALRAVRPDCRIVYAGGGQDDPAAYDDRTWIAAPYTRDGRTVFAVLHDEFQGHRRPALCPTRRYMDCWYNALTLAVSHDAGQHFARVGDTVASLPYRYEAVVGHHAGYFNPSNIVAFDGGWAMFAFATHAGAQAEGNCLLRTTDLADPASWRGWNGAAFAVRFIDPYRAAAPPEEHVCTPVAPRALRWPVTGLVRHAPSGRFLALMQGGGGLPGGDAPGVYVSTSADLRDWTAPVRIFAAIGPAQWRAGEAPPLAYPALLDPASPSRSFETVGAQADLFLTRFNPCGAALCMDRDLLRVPFRISDETPR
jgi:hypothetical protein